MNSSWFTRITFNLHEKPKLSKSEILEIHKSNSYAEFSIKRN